MSRRLIIASPACPDDLIQTLVAIVGRRQVLIDPERTRQYREGYRFGGGPAEAVVRPGSLVELWRVVKACTAADVITIMQAANTGLTGGSTPAPDGYDRRVVIISTLRIDKVYLIDGGRQAICLPGATLYQLERLLAPIGREPHSVIGSSCIGASVLGGVCNNSGGALIHRGPAYSELCLFARVTEGGELELVNHLGIALGNEAEEILTRLDRGQLGDSDTSAPTDRAASDRDYAAHVRDIEAASPARFNGDLRRLFEASGSAGKMIVFAVRLDTFPAPAATRMFYIGSNDPDELTALRRHILSTFRSLPVSGEYLHRNAFDIAARYGKDMVIAIQLFGTARLPRLFKLKALIDASARRLPFLPLHCSDRLLQFAGRLFPQHLPDRMLAFHARYEHHLLLTMADEGIAEARTHLAGLFPSVGGDVFECTAAEARKAALHRFAAAGAAVRFRAVHHEVVEDIVALDVALRRDDRDWCEVLPDEIAAPMLHRLYYGHFFCHVFHQDYIVAKDADPAALEHAMLELLDGRGARYPAEHNFGHLYQAGADVLNHYRSLDPSNVFNPGIGGGSKNKHWA